MNLGSRMFKQLLNMAHVERCTSRTSQKVTTITTVEGIGGDTHLEIHSRVPATVVFQQEPLRQQRLRRGSPLVLVTVSSLQLPWDVCESNARSFA